MRKLFALLLVLCLLPFAALAETIDYNFGDFTMTFPADIKGNITEKAPNQVFFMLYPDYDDTSMFHPNLNCVWTSAYMDMSQADLVELGNQILSGMAENVKAQGIEVTNYRVLTTSMESHDGKPMACLGFQYDADYTDAGVDLKATMYLLQFIFSDPDFGTYNFSYTTNDLSSSDSVTAILNTIKWN